MRDRGIYNVYPTLDAIFLIFPRLLFPPSARRTPSPHDQSILFDIFSEIEKRFYLDLVLDVLMEDVDPICLRLLQVVVNDEATKTTGQRLHTGPAHQSNIHSRANKSETKIERRDKKGKST